LTRFGFVLAGVLVATFVACVVGIAFGAAELSSTELLRGLFGSGDSEVASVIARQIRLPRVIVAVLAGGALGTAGALIQSATRNPIGDPQLFGLGGGAAIVQSTVIAGWLTATVFVTAAVSVAASVAGASFIAVFASRDGVSHWRLAIIGVSLGALTLAVAVGILTYSQVFSQHSLALVSGSLAYPRWADAQAIVVWCVIGIGLAFFVAPRLQVMVLGDRLATHLGSRPNLTRWIAMLAAGFLAGASVSAAGVLGFAGLIAPHLGRLLVGNDARRVVWISFPLGACLVAWADQLARLAFAPSEVPVGMVLTLVGAPFLIAIARRLS